MPDLSRLHNKYHGTAPKGAKYIGRGSPYGNDYVIGKDGTRDEVCDKFAEHQLPNIDLRPLMFQHIICFCKPQRCHGESILQALEVLESEEIKRNKEGK